MVLDEHHRKLIVGSNEGQLKVFDLQSGIMTLELSGHDSAYGMVSFIDYGGEDHTIITCGWDRTIKIHMDEMVQYNFKPQNQQAQAELPLKSDPKKKIKAVESKLRQRTKTNDLSD